MKVKYKPAALFCCVLLLAFIIIANRVEMVSIGTILAGGIVAFFASTTATDFCRSKWYRPELDGK